MGFLFNYSPGRSKRDPFHGISPEYMQAAGCTGCPLQRALKAEPKGAMPALVYILGEAPGDSEVKAGEPFVGNAGKLLRRYIPDGWLKDVRFNNVVKSQPPKDGNRQQTAPTAVAIEHCRGYLTKDIVEARPRAIFGFGNTPLVALTGQTGIQKFAGRRTPIKVGEHTCWYYPFLHPAAILRTDDRQRADAESLFAYQLSEAFASIDTLPEPVIVTPAEARGRIQVLTDARAVVRSLEAAQTCDRVGLDYETNGLSPHVDDARILTVAVAVGDDAFAFPLDHSEAPWTSMERAAIDAALVAFLCAPVVKIVHNAAFELLWSLHFFGKAAVRPDHWGDSLAQAFLLDSRPRAHSLDFLCQLHFGLPLKALSNVDVAHLDSAPVDQVCRYNAMDARYCLKVFEHQEGPLTRHEMMPLYHHHMERVAALVRGQELGLEVDLKVNEALAAEYQGKLDRLTKKLAGMDEVERFNAVGVPFNVGSPKHVQNLLAVEGYVLEGTSEELLATVNTPFAKTVLEHRGLAKILSTYITPLSPASKLVYRGAIHPTIATTHTRTWRTASEDPNIQNFPQRDAQHRGVRKQIVAPPGHLLVSVDYSSIQARNVAMESKDHRLVQAFIHRYDIHQDWSERIQKLAPKWAGKRDAKELRSTAKNKLVFPFFFGAQPGSVSKGLGLPVDKGQKLFDDFWNEFPDIRVWHDRLRYQYRRKHYVTGLSGFRRSAPISENQLINTPIQSDEALLVCEALTRLSQYEDDALQPRALIHDDLTFVIPEERLDECLLVILTEMLRTEHVWINVPLAVEVSAGPDWFEQKKLGQYESNGYGGHVKIG